MIGRAPGLAGLWLAIGHAHWGLTLGPATGRMIAEMMTGAPPFCDPAPYRAERFLLTVFREAARRVVRNLYPRFVIMSSGFAASGARKTASFPNLSFQLGSAGEGQRVAS